VLDHLAVKLVVLSTNDTPFGRELGPTTRDDLLTAPGRIAGVWITPRPLAPCSKGFITVHLERPDGQTIDEAQRPIADVSGERISLALAATDVRVGDQLRLRVDGPANCPIELGPQLNWIVEDGDSPLHIVDTDRGWVYERASALELVSAHTTWASYPTRDDAVAALEDHGGGVTTVGNQPSTAAGTATVESFSLTTNRARAEVQTDTKALIMFSMNDDQAGTRTSTGVRSPLSPPTAR
jgi:hypothetical protein